MASWGQVGWQEKRMEKVKSEIGAKVASRELSTVYLDTQVNLYDRERKRRAG